MKSIKSGSDRIQISTNSMDKNVKLCQNSTSEVSAELQELSAAMEEVNAILQTLEEAGQTVYDAAGQIAFSVDEGADYVSGVAKRANQMYSDSSSNRDITRQKVDEISQDMEQAITDSNAVTKILELTEDILIISNQTNLLALNASIEA